MSQGENDYEKDLKHFTSTIAGKIGEGVKKTESFFSSAEMSQGENEYEKDLQHLTSTFAGKIGKGIQKTESFFSSTEMSQGENDYEKDLQHLTSTIAGKISDGVQKTESFFSSAEMTQGEDDYEKDLQQLFSRSFFSSAEMSQGENDYENDLQQLFSRSLFFSAEMSQRENNFKKDLQQLYTVAGKIVEGTKKAESFFSSACIYRVPEDLRKLNERAYTPRLIAIGPLHREDKHLQTPLQHIKLSYTNYLLSRLAVGMEDQELRQTILTVLKKCLAEMKTSIDNAKKCYAEEVTLDEEMMLVDGCFVLEFLYRCRTLEVQERDPIFLNALAFRKVQKDLVLLENQIPFFVLEKLFRLIVDQIPNRRDKNWSLPDYVGQCYEDRIRPLPNSDNSSSSSAKTWYSSPRDCVLRVFRCTTAAEKEEVQSGNSDRRTAKYYHILHNLHEGCLPQDQTKQEKFSLGEMPSASELVYAGVKFVPDAGNDLFKFKFSEPTGLFWWFRRARFEIPPLAIYDSTESYLRNLIALEQSCPGVSLHVSSYAGVMDTLVNTEKDIQVLEKAGVLRNHLGATGDATDLFNNLCKEIIFGEYFLDTCSQATKYSKYFWPKNVAHVRRTYFDSPWTFIAFVVGFIAFVISLVGFVRDSIKKA